MKRYFLSIVILIVPLIAVSQVDYGLKAGPAISWYRSSTASELMMEYESRTGFQAGVFAEARLNACFSLQPELLLSSRGAKSELNMTVAIPTLTGYTNVKVTLNATIEPLYVDIPVYLKAGFPSVGSDRFMVGVGPVFSYGLGGNAKIKITVGEESFAGNVKLFSEDSFGLGEIHLDFRLLERLDVAAAGFAAYEFSKKVILSFNYQYGLKNISEDPEEELRNRLVSVTLGYKF